jgi:hypothetical protein
MVRLTCGEEYLLATGMNRENWPEKKFLLTIQDDHFLFQFDHFRQND